jgi:hypothetical protein
MKDRGANAVDSIIGNRQSAAGEARDFAQDASAAGKRTKE